MTLYRPHLAVVEHVEDETRDTRTLRLRFKDPAVAEAFDFRAGQFGEYSVFGAGECTFCIASSPTRRGFIECSFKAVGRVTRALREVNAGDTVGFRGPYGNWFPVDAWAGRNVLCVAGGIGLAPVRSVIWNVLDLRDRFGDVTIVHGARSADDLVYKRELTDWSRRPRVRVITTVDPGGETSEWRGEIGFVPAVVERHPVAADNAVAVVCGPPVMIKHTLPVLDRLGFPPDRIYTTLENRMKCGIGKCGRCNVGPAYVCKDGPVFTATELAALPPEF